MNRPAVRLTAALLALAAGAGVLAVVVVSVVHLLTDLATGRHLSQGETVAGVMLAVGVVGLVLVGCCDRPGFAQILAHGPSVFRSLLGTVIARGRR